MSPAVMFDAMPAYVTTKALADEVPPRLQLAPKAQVSLSSLQVGTRLLVGVVCSSSLIA